MKKYIFLTLLFTQQILISQNDSLYILVDDLKISLREDGSGGAGFFIKSEDVKFINDYFYFDLQNANGIDEKGDFIYNSLENIRKEINLDTVYYKELKTISKKMTWWEIHNLLSLENKVFLIRKEKISFNSKNGNYIYKYFSYPFVYKGTRKNVIPTD